MGGLDSENPSARKGELAEGFSVPYTQQHSHGGEYLSWTSIAHQPILAAPIVRPPQPMLAPVEQAICTDTDTTLLGVFA